MEYLGQKLTDASGRDAFEGATLTDIDDALTAYHDQHPDPLTPEELYLVASAGMASVTTEQQALIKAGTIVATTSGGGRYIYSGSGAKTSVGSYYQISDLTPDWDTLTGKPDLSYVATSNVSRQFEPGRRYRLTARITAGTLPASPGTGGEAIEIMTAIDATTNFHTITPDGTETVKVGAVTGSPLEFDGAAGQIIKLIPVSGGWEMGI